MKFTLKPYANRCHSKSLKRGSKLLPALSLLSVTLLTVQAVAAPYLFKDGATEWRLHMVAEAHPAVRYGVEELTNALQKIGNVALPVEVGGEAPATKAVIVGDLTHPAIAARAAELKLQAGEVEEVSVMTLDGSLYLAGNTPRGALYAVYTLLNRELGVRWLWPGEDGEFMPPRSSWQVPQLDIHHKPGYRWRGFHLCGDWRDHQLFRIWMARNFINIHRHSSPKSEQRLGFYSMYSSHNAHLRGSQYFEEHPEYFAEINGKRYASSICFTHPEVLKLVAENLAAHVRKNPHLEILSIYPSDSQDYCRCAECAKMDYSTAWFSFFNRVTDILKEEFPHLKFATLAYQGYIELPKCEIRNAAFVEYASYGRCNTHTFGHPDCPRNAKTLAAFSEWEASGIPIGNYGYEFDIFRRNSRFTPFLSLIDDAIKEGWRRKQVLLVTEVSLSPRTGPITRVRNWQQRLPIYLYAQLMWQPEADMSELVADWCRTVYGPAAQPMCDYLLGLDQAWSAMPRHTGILGDAISVVDTFMTEKQQAASGKLLQRAESLLTEAPATRERERALAALEREATLFKQWSDLAQLKSGGLPLINAPHLTSTTNRTDLRAQSVALSSGAVPTTTVQVAWSDDALLLRWHCGNARSAATADRLEAKIIPGSSGEHYFMRSDGAGTRSSARLSTVGVMEEKWQPEWQVEVTREADAWQAWMTIPFTALGGTPEVETSWQIALSRQIEKETAVFPPQEEAMLYFNRSRATGRRLLYWSGYPEREAGRSAAIKQSLLEAGWEVSIVSTQTLLQAAHESADAYWFRHPNGPVKPPADYWQEQLRPAVSNGAVAFFISYLRIPLETYFNDPALKLRTVSMSGVPLPGRRSTHVAPGTWGTEPYNLANSLQRGYSPCYGHFPTVEDGWQILALAPDGNERPPFPYLIMRRYGKGLIVAGGDAIPAALPHLLENLVHHHEENPAPAPLLPGE